MTTARPDPPDPLAGLNAAQRRAAEAVRGPVCLLAGAGSGKTRTITHRIANQVLTRVAEPEQILAVTFTDRAARELRSRLGGLGLDRPVRAATFHAAAWAQLRYFWREHRDGEPLPDVVESKVRMLIPAARRLGAEARDLAAEIEWAKARRVPPEGYEQAAAGRVPPVPPAHMAEVYTAYEADKRAAGLVDYDDMIGLTTDMLASDPAIAAAVRERYRFFTVDEFQDVNPAQWALLSAWLGEGDELCVVGDDDQAIYSFTGATAEYLTGFAERFPGAVTVALTDNYRSTAAVLSTANRILAARGGPSKQLRARVDDGPPPRLVAADDDAAERALVVARIRELIDEGVAPGEIAVCYRINSQSEPLEAALADAGLPYVVRGDTGFYQRPEIRQAIAALRSAAEQPPAPEMPAPGGAVRAAPPPLAGTVERALRSALSWHPRREPSGRAARERWQNLAALLGMAERAAEADPPPTLAEFAADLGERARDRDVELDAVNLLTLHKAKGLEYDAVFLVALEEGLLPISHASTDEEVEEERRLLYVGVTRARRHLQLSWAHSRPGWRGRPQRRRPSRFLEALQARPIGRPGATGRTAAAAARRPADDPLADRLRDWRRERARADGVPAYVVFPDATLAELSQRRPSTPDELRAVPGLGPTRVARYGTDLLALLGESS